MVVTVDEQVLLSEDPGSCLGRRGRPGTLGIPALMCYGAFSRPGVPVLQVTWVQLLLARTTLFCALPWHTLRRATSLGCLSHHSGCPGKT